MPIGTISEQFSYLRTANRDVVVTPRVPKQEVINLHDHLKKIDPAYSSEVVPLKEHLKKLPKMVAFMEKHVISTPYSFSVQKCDNVVCCGQIRSHEENGIWDLVMQRQPTPQADPTREGHFKTKIKR